MAAVFPPSLLDVVISAPPQLTGGYHHVFLYRALILSASLLMSACAYPIINHERVVEVKHIVAVVECEPARRKPIFFLPAEANASVADGLGYWFQHRI